MTTMLQTYPKYAKSGPVWFGELPDEWGVVPMRSLFETKKQFVADKSDQHLLLSLTMGGVKHRDLCGTGKNPTNYESYQAFRKNDLVACLFDYDVTPRTIGYVEEDGMMTGAYTRLIPRANVDSKYFYYLYLYLDERKELLHQCTGLRNSISKPVFWSLQNPRPPVDTQQRIAGFLDKKTKIIDELVAKKEKLIELLYEKRIALITHTVTKGLDSHAKLKPSGVEWLGDIPEEWPTRRIRFIVKTNPSKSEISGLPNQVVSFLPMSHVSEHGTLDFSDEREMNFVYNGFTYFRNGDVILAKITPCFENGKGAFVTGLKNTIGFGSTEFHVFRPKQIAGKYLYYFFMSDGFKKFGELNMKGTAGQKRVPELFIKDFIIGIPPEKEQVQISDYLDAKTESLDSVVLETQSQIEKLNEYRSSLIYSAVTGKIKIQ